MKTDLWQLLGGKDVSTESISFLSFPAFGSQKNRMALNSKFKEKQVNKQTKIDVP